MDRILLCSAAMTLPAVSLRGVWALAFGLLLMLVVPEAALANRRVKASKTSSRQVKLQKTKAKASLRRASLRPGKRLTEFKSVARPTSKLKTKGEKPAAKSLAPVTAGTRSKNISKAKPQRRVRGQAKRVRKTRRVAYKNKSARGTATRHERSAHKSKGVGVLAGLKSLAKGLFKSGPMHMINSIKNKPMQFAVGVVAMGIVGALASVTAANGHFIAIGLSIGAVVLQVAKMKKPFLKANMTTRLEMAGEVLFSSVVVGFTATVVPALMESVLGPVGAHGVPGKVLAIDIAKEAAIAAGIGADAPGVAVSAMESN